MKKCIVIQFKDTWMRKRGAKNQPTHAGKVNKITWDNRHKKQELKSSITK